MRIWTIEGLNGKRNFKEKVQKRDDKKKRKDYQIVCNGETWRSAYGRTCAHVKDFQNLEEDSQLLESPQIHKDW